MPLDQIQSAQERLIAALDAQDAQEIIAASGALSALIDELRDLPSLQWERSARETLEQIEQLSNAAAQRLRLLTDHTRTRLQMLGADQGALAYGPRAA